jgi:hypothetical protein
MMVMPLARTTLSLLHAYRDASGYPREVQSRLLNTLLRHLPVKLNVSRAAHAEAKRRSLGDLRRYLWEHQPTLMGDIGRKVFAYDHYVPVAELRRQLEDLEKPSERQIRGILSQASVVWVRRGENAELDRLGYRSRRPDPAAAYEAARIILVHREWRSYSDF